MSDAPRRLDADLLTAAEIERLLKACSHRAPTGIRNRAILALAWRSGLRASEITSLRVKDVSLEDGTLVVQRGKGGKRRVGAIDAGTAALISRWLEVRRKRRIRSDVLFCTLRGGELDPSYFRHLLPRLAKRAGITKRVHLHGLRHRFAVELVEEGAPLTTVRDLLGHSSAATTSRYLTRIGATEAVAFARAREWSSS